MSNGRKWQHPLPAPSNFPKLLPMEGHHSHPSSRSSLTSPQICCLSNRLLSPLFHLGYFYPCMWGTEKYAEEGWFLIILLPKPHSPPQCRKRKSISLRGTQSSSSSWNTWLALLKLHSAGTGYLFSLEEAEDNYRCGLILAQEPRQGFGQRGNTPPCHQVPWPHFYARSDVGLEGHRVLVWSTGSLSQLTELPGGKEPPAERGCWEMG